MPLHRPPAHKPLFQSMSVALLVFLVCAAIHGALAWTQPDTLRIMPLGNSITESRQGNASYRCWLWEKLEKAGMVANFVGSRSGVFVTYPGQQTASVCTCATFDEDHEGHWFWRTDEVLYGSTGERYSYPGSLGQWVQQHKPNMVLVHLGSNDIFQGQKVDSTVQELGAVIDTVRSHCPQAAIVLAQLIPSTRQIGDSIPFLNEKIPLLAGQKTTSNSPVTVVDLWTGFNAGLDTQDGIHPNKGGEQKMANKWFQAIDSLYKSSAGVYLKWPQEIRRIGNSWCGRTVDIHGRMVRTVSPTNHVRPWTKAPTAVLFLWPPQPGQSKPKDICTAK